MLTEWWTYRPHDFLMFSPRIYWRLFESINEAWWPMAVLFATCAVAVSTMWAAALVGELRAHAHGTAIRGPQLASQRQGPWPLARQLMSQVMGPGMRALMLPAALLTFAVLAAAWMFVAVAFLWQRFTPIFWAAEAAAWAFALQALGWLLLACLMMPGGTLQDGMARVGAAPRRLLVGAAMASAAVLLYPLLAPLAGRPWQQAELFGLAPEPTVLFSLGVLVLLPSLAGASALLRALTRVLWLVPLAWCAVSSGTLALMGSWQALLPVAAALLALWARTRGSDAKG